MTDITQALQDTRKAIGSASAARSRIQAEGFQAVPAKLLEALIDLTKAQVSLEVALQRRAHDIDNKQEANHATA